MKFETESEDHFYSLCKNLDYKIDKIPVAKTRQPDFRVANKTAELIAEVKEIDDNNESMEIMSELEPYKYGKNEELDIHIGDVNVGRTTLVDSKIEKSLGQLKQYSKQGFETLLVIYMKRFLGGAVYEPEIALRKGIVEIPPEISAIMLLDNKGITNQFPPEEPYKIYPNQGATIPWAGNFFN